jgi:AcrR family transcriptional regulator
MSGKNPRGDVAIDRRSARTRRLLHEALMRLIVRKDYDAITVQDLLDEADVGRSTFYAHFAGKDELLRKGFERLRQELSLGTQRSVNQGNVTPLAFSSVMFAHAAQYKENYRAMVGSYGGAIVRAEIRRVLLGFVEPELDRPIHYGIPTDLVARFIVDGFQTVLEWWLDRHPELDPAKVDRMFRQMVLASLAQDAQPATSPNAGNRTP